MWRATEHNGLGLEDSLFPHQAAAQSKLHDTYHRQQQQNEADQIEDNVARAQFAAQNVRVQQDTNAATSQPPGMSLGPGLPQLDLESITLSNALGISGDHMLARLQQNPGDQIAHSSPELSAILAASLGFLPGQQASRSLLTGSEASAGLSAVSSHTQLPPESMLISKDDLVGEAKQKAAPASTSQFKLDTELDEIVESDENSDVEDGSSGAKRKAPMTEADRKRRRQEINRQSARRIRERRSHEMEKLKQQNATLLEHQSSLLRYASTLAREKNLLVQRTLELTERWNQAAAENLELRGKLKQ